MLGWEEFEKECAACVKCSLGKTRTNIVIERGSRTAPLMLIGEGPGEQEDRQGKPFVGAAGQLLDLLLSALMFQEDEYYICNIVKCRPPQNRVPTDDEAEACLPWLRNQTALIRPHIIVCMGATAMKYVIDKNAKITQIRGRWIERKGFWILPTFHPAALLRDASKKVLMFEDMKSARHKLDEFLGG
ncbi:MAG: uracil-DNA glycosylase [Clostridiaceae bacterium]